MAALKKNRKISRILLLILLPVPIIGAAIYALVTKEMEFGQALIYGAVISGIILVINLLSGMSHGAKHGYEAVVIDKKYSTYTNTSCGSTKGILCQGEAEKQIDLSPNETSDGIELWK